MTEELIILCVPAKNFAPFAVKKKLDQIFKQSLILI